MAEVFNSLFKAELVRTKGPWSNIDDLEIIVAAEYIDWFNFRRFHGEIGLVPPAEFETNPKPTPRTSWHSAASSSWPCPTVISPPSEVCSASRTVFTLPQAHPGPAGCDRTGCSGLRARPQPTAAGGADAVQPAGRVATKLKGGSALRSGWRWEFR